MIGLNAVKFHSLGEQKSAVDALEKSRDKRQNDFFVCLI